MKDKIKLRLATRKDRLGMKEVNEKCLAENYDVTLWEKIVAQKNSFVIVCNGLIVGYILCSDDKILDESKNSENSFTVYSFAIMENHRGKGFGNKLIQMAIDNIRSKKLEKSTMTLHVRISNNGAIHLYEKFGFKKIEILNLYYDDKESAYIMKLVLE